MFTQDSKETEWRYEDSKYSASSFPGIAHIYIRKEGAGWGGGWEGGRVEGGGWVGLGVIPFIMPGNCSVPHI